MTRRRSSVIELALDALFAAQSCAWWWDAIRSGDPVFRVFFLGWVWACAYMARVLAEDLLVIAEQTTKEVMRQMTRG